jgi:predicted Zn-dependent protease
MSPVLFVALGALAWADTPLDALSPELRARFEAAEAAWERGELAVAETAFTEVTEGAPTFDRAWRRRCGVVLAAGRAPEAEGFCRKAVELQPSLENRVALSLALLDNDGHDEAEALLRAAVREQPDYVPAQVGVCTWAHARRDDETLGACAARLAELAPGTAGTLYFTALDLAARGELEAASNTLVAARAEGLSDELARDAGQGIAGRARANAARTDRKPDGKRDESGWTAADLLPIGLGAALVLAVGILAFGRDDENEKPAG